MNDITFRKEVKEGNINILYVETKAYDLMFTLDKKNKTLEIDEHRNGYDVKTIKLEGEVIKALHELIRGKGI